MISPPFQLQNLRTEFHSILYERHAIRGHHYPVILIPIISNNNMKDARTSEMGTPLSTVPPVFARTARQHSSGFRVALLVRMCPPFSCFPLHFPLLRFPSSRSATNVTHFCSGSRPERPLNLVSDGYFLKSSRSTLPSRVRPASSGPCVVCLFCCFGPFADRDLCPYLAGHIRTDVRGLFLVGFTSCFSSYVYCRHLPAFLVHNLIYLYIYTNIFGVHIVCYCLF
jgi:hypothetical protein